MSSAATPMMQMGPGAAMLITVGVIVLALVLLERWVNRRKRRREAARIASATDTGEHPESRDKSAESRGLWGALFGPPAGQDPPYDPMQDVHPDELEGNYDNDPPSRGGL